MAVDSPYAKWKHKLITIKKDVLSIRAEETFTLLMNLSTGKLYKTNKTGEHILKILLHKPGITIEGIIKILKKDFEDVDEEVLREDLLSFLEELEKIGVIE